MTGGLRNALKPVSAFKAFCLKIPDGHPNIGTAAGPFLELGFAWQSVPGQGFDHPIRMWRVIKFDPMLLEMEDKRMADTDMAPFIVADDPKRL